LTLQGSNFRVQWRTILASAEENQTGRAGEKTAGCHPVRFRHGRIDALRVQEERQRQQPALALPEAGEGLDFRHRRRERIRGQAKQPVAQGCGHLCGDALLARIVGSDQLDQRDELSLTFWDRCLPLIRDRVYSRLL